MGEITLRAATLDDAAAIAAIYNQAVLHTTATFDTRAVSIGSRAAWLEEHCSPRHPVLVAETPDRRVVGWASLSPWSGRCAYDATVEISTYVDEGHKGEGLGTRLSQAVLDIGAREGVHAVISRMCSENEASIKMAKRLGFEKVGVLREVGSKFGRLLDVVIMQRILG